MHFMNLKDFAAYAEKEGLVTPKKVAPEVVIKTVTVIKPVTSKTVVQQKYTAEELAAIAAEEELEALEAAAQDELYDELSEEYDDPTYVSFIKRTTNVRVVKSEVLSAKKADKEQTLNKKMNRSLKRGY